MMDGAVMRSYRYSGTIPKGSVVVFSDESTVKLPAGTATDKVCGVYSQYKNEDASDSATGEALPITVMGLARVCVKVAVSAGDSVYITGTTGEVTGTKATGLKHIGRFLEDGAVGDYVLALVQVGE